MSHVIKFEHPLKDDEYELININEGENLSNWIAENLHNENVHILLNDEVLNDTNYLINQHDVITIRPILQSGVDWIVWVSLAISVASAAYSYAAMPDAADNADTQQASSVYNYNNQGNKPKLGNPVTVQYGRIPHYPDLIAPPWWEYDNNEQFYYQTFSKGIGKFEIHDHYIGETPLSNYLGDVEVRVYQPNQLVNHFHHIVWTSDEVGSSDGRSGLVIAGATPRQNVWRKAGEARFSHNYVTLTYLTSSDGSLLRWPWLRDEYVIIRSAADNAYIFNSSVDFIDGLAEPDSIYSAAGFANLSVGQSILLVSEQRNGGKYTVRSKSADGRTITLNSDYNGPAVTNFVPLLKVPIKIYRANLNDGVYICTGTGATVALVRADTLKLVTEWKGFQQTTYRDVTVSTFNPEQGAVWRGDFASCPTGDVSQNIAIDLIMPQGLGYSADNGYVTERTVQVEVRYRLVDTLNYTKRTLSFTEATRTPQRRTIWLDLPVGRWDIGIRRITEESDNSRIFDEIQWSGLKSMMMSNYRNNHETIITLKIIATSALSQQANQKYWCDATRILEVKQANGTYLEQSTSSIADALIDACRNKVYGASLSDDAIDFDTILAYKEKWRQRGDECNGLFDQPTSFWDAISTILQVGRAYPRIDFGSISLWRDEPRQALCKPYSPVNMSPDSFSADIRLNEEDDYDSVEIEWFNPRTRKSDTQIYALKGHTDYNPKQLKMPFITNIHQADREGFFHAAVQAYRRTNISFTTDLDGWESNYGDLVPIAHDSMLWGQSGQVLEVLNSGNTRYLQLSGLLEWTPDQQHYIIFNIGNADGIHGPYRLEKTEVEDIVILIDAPTQQIYALGERGQQASHYMFGVAEKLYKRCILMKVKQTGEFKVSCEAIEEDSRIDAYA